MPLTTSEVAGLPIIPTYIPGELTQAHFQRIADQNFIGVSEVNRQFVKFVADRHSRTDPLYVKEPIANLLGHPLEVVEKLGLTDYLVVPGNQASVKRVCPICLAEGMPVHLLLAEPAYGICHVHRVANVHRCASCDRRLKWGNGDYFHCCCGFDLRLSPTICIDSESCALYLSCLLGRPLNSVNGFAKPGGHVQESDRLSTTAAYLMQDKGIQSDVKAFEKDISTAVQREALQWLAIGMRIGNDNTKLNDVVIGIEARHIWGPAQQEWMLSRSQHLTASINWEPLRFLARAAQSKAIDYRPSSEASMSIARSNEQFRRNLELLVGKREHISSFLMNELLYEVYNTPHEFGTVDRKESARLNALVQITQDLRWIDDARWDLDIPISTKGEILSFIAAGVFHPYIALAIEHWHVNQQDVAEVFNRIWQGRYPKVTPDSEELFIVPFEQVFSPDNSPTDWISLPLVDIQRRVTALLKGDSFSIFGFQYFTEGLKLPLGFCAFLSKEDCQNYCNPQQYRLNSFVLVSSSLLTAATALVNACLRAQEKMRALEKWPKVAAQVAEENMIYTRIEKSRARVLEQANSHISRFFRYPYKNLALALRTYFN